MPRSSRSFCSGLPTVMRRLLASPGWERGSRTIRPTEAAARSTRSASTHSTNKKVAGLGHARRVGAPQVHELRPGQLPLVVVVAEDRGEGQLPVGGRGERGAHRPAGVLVLVTRDQVAAVDDQVGALEVQDPSRDGGGLLVGRRWRRQHDALQRHSPTWELVQGPSGGYWGRVFENAVTWRDGESPEGAEDDATILFGRCDQDMGVPYQPFVEALQPLVEGSPSAQLSADLGARGADLARLMPDVATRLPYLRPASTGEAEVERHRMFEAAVGLVAAASRRHRASGSITASSGMRTPQPNGPSYHVDGKGPCCRKARCSRQSRSSAAS